MSEPGEGEYGGTADLVQWTLTDHLNTVRDIAKYDPQTDTTTVVNHLVYDAFGNVTSETNPAVDSLFLFTARPFDADTGLQNNLNRWYDAAVGRWLSEDPIGFAAGDGNLYRYVHNSPTFATDPIGLQFPYPGVYDPDGVMRPPVPRPPQHVPRPLQPADQPPLGAQYPGTVLTPGDLVSPTFDPFNPQPQPPLWPFVPRPPRPSIPAESRPGTPPSNAQCLSSSRSDWLDCMAACVEDNDPISLVVEAAAAQLTVGLWPKRMFAAMADAMGNHRLANAIRYSAHYGNTTTMPKALLKLMRAKPHKALDVLLRYGGKTVGRANIAYGLALAAIEVHCCGYCTTAAAYGIPYNPREGNIYDTIKRAYFS